MKNPIVINSRVVFFFSPSLPRPDRLGEKIKEEMPDVFNQPSIVVPVPDRIELDSIAIVQLQSSSLYSGDIARKNTTFSLTGLGDQNYVDIKEEFRMNVRKYVTPILDSQDVKISRMGFVTDFFVKDTDGAQTISKLVSDSLKNSHEGVFRDMKLRYVTRHEGGGLEFNNVTQLEKVTGSIIENGESIDTDGVLIKRDFNTVPEKNYSHILHREGIDDFLNACEFQFGLEKIIKSLWPHEEVAE